MAKQAAVYFFFSLLLLLGFYSYLYSLLVFYNLLFCVIDPEQVRLLGAEATAFTIDGLQADEVLAIGVAVVVDQRVGEVVTLSARTNPSNGGLPLLRITDVSPERIRIAWSLTSRATGYKIIWRRDGGQE